MLSYNAPSLLLCVLSKNDSFPGPHGSNARESTLGMNDQWLNTHHVITATERQLVRNLPKIFLTFKTQTWLRILRLNQVREKSVSFYS